jgi:hypothetical protein
MRVIRIDDEVWQALKERSEPLEDTPNDVLRREFGLESAKKTKKMRQEEITPISSYHLPILRALYELGGNGKTSIVLSRVEELMKGQLNEVDLQLTSNDLPRWKRNAQNARLNMVGNGLINKKPHGIWELTQKGMSAAKQAAAKHGW